MHLFGLSFILFLFKLLFAQDIIYISSNIQKGYPRVPNNRRDWNNRGVGGGGWTL